MTSEREGPTGNEIAIIGMAGRFPGAASIDAFWENICSGVDSIRRLRKDELGDSKLVPAELLSRPDFVCASGWLGGAERFDHRFFGFSPREALWTDPQQRLFMECAWSALENAAYDPHSYSGKIALYAGAGSSTHFSAIAPAIQDDPAGLFEAFIGSAPDSLATKTSFKLKLRGESMLVSTACSTGLVVVHMACQSLLLGQCDMALAGAVSVVVPQRVGYLYQPNMIASPDGYCRSFDANAEGTVHANGIGVVVLKRLAQALSDRDHIYAIIRGTAINNDGDQKVGFTAPSIEGQAEVIADALAFAEVHPEQIAYVEAHGTGTRLGDPVEVAALTHAYRRWTKASRYCALGSLKNNVGHMDTAAGIAGLIKVALSLHNHEIPPHIHFERPNPDIDFDATPFLINRARKPWPRLNGRPRFGAVSSFGIGGTNAHAVLQEAPVALHDPPSAPAFAQPVVLSARTEKALAASSRALAAHLTSNPTLSLSDVAYTLAVGRKALAYRRVVIASDLGDLRNSLSDSTEPATKRLTGCVDDLASARGQKVSFLFPGQDAAIAGMGRDAFASQPTFRKVIDACSEVLKPILGEDLRKQVCDATASSSDWLDPEFGLPALFATEYALAMLFISWGIRPAALFGYSFGEYVAATVAEVMSLEDGLRLAAVRGKLMSKMPEGAMIAVAAKPEQVLASLGDECSLAAVNAPGQCVISGALDEIAGIEHELRSQGIATTRLPVRRAFHSRDVEPLIPELENAFLSVRLREPKLPYVSSLTGKWLTPAEAVSPRYWIQQMRDTVRFETALATLGSTDCKYFLETGPGQTMTSLARRQLGGGKGGHRVLAAMPRKADASSQRSVLLELLASVWLEGLNIEWGNVFLGVGVKRVPLPTYPFDVDGCDFRLPEAAPAPAQALPGSREPDADRSERRASAGAPIQPRPSPVSHDRHMRMSCVQERILKIAESDPANPALNMQVVAELTGRVAPDRMKQALAEVIGRHEVLRSSYLRENGSWTQRLASNAIPEFSVIDLRGMPDPRNAALERARADVATPFDLSRAPLARATLLRIDEQKHVLVMTIHHVISDAPSLGILLKEVTALYAGDGQPAPAPLPALAIQYPDFACWQRDNLNGPAFEEQVTYWRQKLAYLPPSLEIPGARLLHEPSRKDLRAGRVTFSFGRRLADGIRTLSRNERVTPFWVLLAAYATLLHRLSERDDILIGTPIANRSRAELAPLIGYVAHSLPLRIDLSGDPTFKELLRRVRETTLGAYAHADIPFEWLSGELRENANAGASPLFDALLVMQNIGHAPKADKLSVEVFAVPDAPNGPSAFGAILADLTLFVYEEADGYHGALGYSTERFERATAERILLQFTLLAADAVANQDRHVSALRLALDGQANPKRSNHSSNGRRKGPSFSLSYFATEDNSPVSPNDKYALLLQSAKFADEHDFEAIWTPERHFHAFGGLFPSPAVTSAALATLTKKIQLRAGSVVLPLHDPISVAEEWAVIDNLSGGRVGISFAPGWNAADFVLAPEVYPRRKAEMVSRINAVRRLWRGEAVRRRDGNGKDVEVRVSPLPIQSELPTWLTTTGNPDSFRIAGKIGAGILTNLLGQTLDALGENIALYRSAFRDSGAPNGGRGHVTLMLHTFLGPNMEVRERVRAPLLRYLRSSLHLTSSAVPNQGASVDPRDLDQRDIDELLEHAFDRFIESAGLFGSPEHCLAMVRRLQALDVDEVACLIDFGMDIKSILESLERLAELRILTTSHLASSR